MLLKVIGSSSAGNCYILESETEALIIEAGVNLAEVKKALDFNISKIVGCICSHSHGDHSKFISEYLDNCITVWVSEETLHEIELKGWRSPFLYEANKAFKVGEFKIKPFELRHDVKCHGFLIKHDDFGNCIFCTDTHFIPYFFKGLNNILVECNYDEDILEQNIMSGKLPGVVRNRVLKSHISLDVLKQFLLANDLSQVMNIVLLHLSAGNSNARMFVDEISKLTGKNVVVADKGMTINFDKNPF